MIYQHLPVMLSEVLSILSPRSGQIYIDCTLGGAGYTLALSKVVGKEGKVIAIDADPLAIDNAKKIIKEQKIKNIILVHDNFKNLANIINSLGLVADGIVFDLGLSSAQLNDEKRGFSFYGDRPLDMAFGIGSCMRTTDLLNHASLEELTSIFKELGEEPLAYSIAREIVAARKNKVFTSTKPLVDIILKVNSSKKIRFSKIHPATRVFQALRLATNNELGNLHSALMAVPQVLKVGGYLVVVSFHSGEDRIVKQWLKKESTDCICPPKAPVCVCKHKASFQILFKRPLLASKEEISLNPRSRSAKLRAAKKIR